MWRIADAFVLAAWRGSADDNAGADDPKTSSLVIASAFATDLARDICSSTEKNSGKQQPPKAEPTQRQRDERDAAIRASLLKRIPLFCFPVSPSKSNPARRKGQQVPSRNGGIAPSVDAFGLVSSTQRRKRFSSEKLQQHRFVLTEEDGSRLHGFCRVVSKWDPLLEESATASFREDITAPTEHVLCLVSTHPWAPMMWHALRLLEKRIFSAGGVNSDWGCIAAVSFARGLCRTRRGSLPAPGEEIRITTGQLSPDDSSGTRVQPTGLTNKSDDAILQSRSRQVSIDDLLGVGFPSVSSARADGDLLGGFVPSVSEPSIDSSLSLADIDSKPLLTAKPPLDLPTEYRLYRPNEEDMRREINLRQLIDLPADDFVAIFASLLLERRIVFTSKSLSKLSAAVLSLLQLLPASYGIHWQHIFIPVLPTALLEFSMAPVPFVIGVHTSALDELRKLHIERVLFVHLDEGYANCAAFEEDVQLLPERKILAKAVTDAKLSAVLDTFSVLDAVQSWHGSVFGHLDQLQRARTVGVMDFIKSGRFFHRKFLAAFTETQMFQQWQASAGPNATTGFNAQIDGQSSWASPSRFRDAFAQLKGSLSSLALHEHDVPHSTGNSGQGDKSAEADSERIARRQRREQRRRRREELAQTLDQQNRDEQEPVENKITPTIQPPSLSRADSLIDFDSPLEVRHDKEQEFTKTNSAVCKEGTPQSLSSGAVASPVDNGLTDLFGPPSAALVTSDHRSISSRSNLLD